MAVAQTSGIRPAHRLGRLLGERNRELQPVVGDSLDSPCLVPAHEASGVWVDRLAVAFGGARAVQRANVERMSTVSALTSGVGECTTVDLALGLLAPDEGEVVVAGEPLRAEDLAWWRHQVAYVPQESLLLAGTLRDNLVWSTSRPVSDAECLDAGVRP